MLFLKNVIAIVLRSRIIFIRLRLRNTGLRPECPGHGTPLPSSPSRPTEPIPSGKSPERQYLF
jgi:hypothetical protein